MLALIAATIYLVALPFPATEARSNYGDGISYKLKVVQDVWLENSRNYNSYPWLLVGRHPQYPKKRSLIQFANLPSSCPANKIRWAKMYLYLQYAHKPSWHSVTRSPYTSRPIQVHMVKKRWSERQATSTRRLNGIRWSGTFLDVNNNDAEATPQDCAKILYTERPRGFVEFDVTRAVRSWRQGTPNYGLLLWATDENLAGRDRRFASNAERDRSKHGYIIVMCNY